MIRNSVKYFAMVIAFLTISTVASASDGDLKTDPNINLSSMPSARVLDSGITLGISAIQNSVFDSTDIMLDFGMVLAGINAHISNGNILGIDMTTIDARYGILKGNFKLVAGYQAVSSVIDINSVFVSASLGMLSFYSPILIGVGGGDMNSTDIADTAIIALELKIIGLKWMVEASNYLDDTSNDGLLLIGIRKYTNSYSLTLASNMDESGVVSLGDTITVTFTKLF